jgi:hypothetical protein
MLTRPFTAALCVLLFTAAAAAVPPPPVVLGNLLTPHRVTAKLAISRGIVIRFKLNRAIDSGTVTATSHQLRRDRKPVVLDAVALGPTAPGMVTVRLKLRRYASRLLARSRTTLTVRALVRSHEGLWQDAARRVLILRSRP